MIIIKQLVVDKTKLGGVGMFIKKILKLRTPSTILADFLILEMLLSSYTVYKELESFTSKIKFSLVLLIIAYLFVRIFKDFRYRITNSDLASEEKKKNDISINIYIGFIILFTIIQIIIGWTL